MAGYAPNDYTYHCPSCNKEIDCRVLLVPATSQLVIDVEPIKEHFKRHVELVRAAWEVLEPLATSRLETPAEFKPGERVERLMP